LSPHNPIKLADVLWENNSLFSKQFGDIYFSTDGGRKESIEVYLEGNNLEERFSSCSQFVVGEIGFGTALNFALTVELWERYRKPGAELFYISFEKYPLEPFTIKKVLESQRIDQNLIEQIVQKLPLPIGSLHVIDFPEYQTRLLLSYGDASENIQEISARVDAWYLDGFAPRKNPETWTKEILQAVSRLSHSQSTASTYSVSSSVKDGLSEMGWEVQKIPGSGAKKQILRAKFLGEAISKREISNPKIAVIGAGLAGCAIAEAFSRRGAAVTIFDSRSDIALAASGNELGIVLPYPSKVPDCRHRFYLASFLYLKSVLRRFDFKQEGILFHPLKDKGKSFFDEYSKYEYPAEFAQVVGAAESSSLSGINIDQTNLFFPMAGAVSFPHFCKKLVQNVELTKLNFTVSDIGILVNDYDLIVLAQGANLDLIPEFVRLEVYPLKGETALVYETAETKKLRMPVCSGGYICPSTDGVHLVGSTYEPRVNDELLSDTGEAALGKIFNNFLPEIRPEFKSRRAGVRVASKDRMPIVGEIESAGNAKVLISTAHGSRGGVSAMLSAELLAARYFGEPEPIENSLSNAIGLERVGRKG
jgi:tRNA 5-methylaminomethyl-2-thiouridine biosynthesis bifunctional protein